MLERDHEMSTMVSFTHIHTHTHTYQHTYPHQHQHPSHPTYTRRTQRLNERVVSHLLLSAFATTLCTSSQLKEFSGIGSSVTNLGSKLTKLGPSGEYLG
jgi:hypothetical protein